ncbi:MAG: CapA family protein [Lachnospiraceae bacterium]|nr:CapA family protein [Lachnospiraceae bacterium]MBD5455058.1 CapA family protein [Lachnospiraceae bacterium]
MPNNKKQKRNKRISPGLTFLLTLSLVLGIGLAAMLVYSEHADKAVINSGDWREDIVETIGYKNDNAFDSSQETNSKEPAEKDSSRYGAILSDKEYMESNHIYEKPNKTEGIVTLGFAGDILFDDEYAVMANLLRRGGSMENGISESLLSKMQDMDIMMINNEFPYTDRGTPTQDKMFTFRADPSTVNYLDDMGVDIVSVANNHIFDFGEMGLLDTLSILEEKGMPYVGAGRNLEEAMAPVYFISGDIKIAVVSATQIERLDNPDTRGATENTAGVFRCWNPEKLYEVVARAKEDSDFVIVYIHWGTENVAEPDWAQLDQAPKLAEAGADLIIGDHPHCLQGIQYFGKVPVIYSLGNFWFNSKTVDTCLIQVDISEKGIESLQFIPAIQEGCRTDFANGEEKERIISYMNSISYSVTIDSEGFVMPE